MDKFNKLPKSDKEAALKECAAQRGVLPIIIEKDFWVCWTLNKLFTNSTIGKYLTFRHQ